MIDGLIAQVKDPVIRKILDEMNKELKRIRSIQPTNENPKNMAYTINKIIGKLK